MKSENAVYSWIHTLQDMLHVGRQMSHLSVQTELDSFFKPALLHSDTSTTYESLVD
jgi:phosphate-selective porin